ncbi:hypothetical protein RP20_CCG011728 [Aedes albopictus]|nr:hypothetical protein RP20_CCG011728 [Aedes albopictus]
MVIRKKAAKKIDPQATKGLTLFTRVCTCVSVLVREVFLRIIFVFDCVSATRSRALSLLVRHLTSAENHEANEEERMFW